MTIIPTRGPTNTCSSGQNNHPNTVDVVGHTPRNVAQWVSKFLKRTSNPGSVKVKGKRVNRGAGYGLGIQCVYTFWSNQFSLALLKSKINKADYNLLGEKL